jgi:hypothetical protein
MRGGELRKVEMLKVVIKNRRGAKKGSRDIFPQIEGNSEVKCCKIKAKIKVKKFPIFETKV